MAKRKNRALVLSGGGARAAYQAGVLKAISDVLEEAGYREQPFQIYTGESAGAINVSLLAGHADDFAHGTSELWRCWAELEMDNVLATNPLTLLGNAGRWMGELSLGGLLGMNRPAFLLDNGPLRKYLAPKLKLGRAHDLIHEKRLAAFGITVTNYATGSAVTYYDCAHECPPWSRSNRLGLPAELKLDHVIASTAIPILFPAVKIGQCYYGDGSVRMKAPLSPAIHLGASSILAIGLRYHRTPEETLEINQHWKMKSISLADVAGVLLNAGFLDNLDGDLERLERINHTLDLIPGERRRDLKTMLHPIEALAIHPSEDVGQLASKGLDSFTGMMRFLMKGLGTARSSSWDLVSYLAFDKAYTCKLLALGHADGLAKKEALLKFFLDE